MSYPSLLLAELILPENWLWYLLLLGLGTGLFIWWRFKGRQSYRVEDLSVDFGSSNKVSFKVKRNVENLYIANRIYLELVTRKAALDFEEDKDVIKEVYDSWYTLFGIIREEIKNVPGQYLQQHDATEALIGLTTEILNQGLRPHLTTYQAKFRRWYAAELEKPENQDRSPQEIQQRYPDYPALVADLRRVNKLLQAYAGQLKKLIKGK